ncbi:MAG: hypothetical protein AAGB23_11930 [Pseudomonadota bacterium]
MIARITAALVLAGTALSPAALSAQQSSPVRTYHLMQLTVKSSTVSLADFEEKTQAIRSCGDVKDLIEPLDAEWSRNRFVPERELPSDIREMLKDQPTGQSSPILTVNGSYMTIFVICNRT